MKRVIKLSIPLILLVGLILGGGYYYSQLNEAPVDWVEDDHLLIEKGMTVSSIGRYLEKLGVIKSYVLFRLIHEVTGRRNVIPTGSYTLEAGMTTIDIYRKLVSGRQDMLRITFPEGATITSMANELESYGVCKSSDFLEATADKGLLSEYSIPNASFEGYLFPDTYQFVYDESAENVIRAMADNFFRKIDEIYINWDELTARQFNNKITMASIVEKEYRLPEEAPLIASVFYNRLESPDFPFLQSCATVVYVITEIQGKEHPDRLYYRDLEIDNPYNTYSHSGLPPAPICNPGLTSLKASFFPAQTDYIFFVVKDSRLGSHNFSSNYADFINHKDSYLENFRSK